MRYFGLKTVNSLMLGYVWNILFVLIISNKFSHPKKLFPALDEKTDLPLEQIWSKSSANATFA